MGVGVDGVREVTGMMVMQGVTGVTRVMRVTGRKR